jgi:hypothetical protein
MNESQFIATALTYPTYVSIWYSPSTPFFIKGIMIPIINDSGQSILEYLEEATELVIEIQDGILVNLEISNGQFQTATPGGEQLYYFKVTPEYNITDIVNSPTFTTQVSISSIIFIDVANQYEFNASGYNVILNNVDNTRASQYQYLGQTGVLANVQDSLYSSTGWINGRYEGSQTTQTNYLGISPTIAGKSFEGAYFPRTILDQQIKDQITAGAVTYIEYLYPGEEVLPTYIITSGSYKIAATTINGDPGSAVGTISVTQTEIPLLTEPGAPASAPTLKIGDILQVASSLELMKIKNIDTYNNNGNYTVPFYKLIVERGYNYTTPQQIVTDYPALEPPVLLSTPSLIFRLQGNKVQGVQRGKVQVKVSQDILHIDRFGYIISSSR